MERDPRVSPRPGDALIYGPQHQSDRIDVIGLDQERDYIKVLYFGSLNPIWVTRQWWVETMVGAEVVAAKLNGEAK